MPYSVTARRPVPTLFLPSFALTIRSGRVDSNAQVDAGAHKEDKVVVTAFRNESLTINQNPQVRCILVNQEDPAEIVRVQIPCNNP